MRSTRNGWLGLVDTHLGIWDEWEDRSELAMRNVLARMVTHLKGRGFTLSFDRQHSHLTRIAKYYWYGRRGDLELTLSLCGRATTLEFFQNLNVKNPNGGRYDFNKLRRMNRTMRLECIVELYKAAQAAQDLYGYPLTSRNGFRRSDVPITLMSVRDLAEQRKGTPLEDFNAGWGSDRFERDETGWPSVKELRCWRSKDRDGIPVFTGATKFYRHRGRLMRCTAYPNMNDMWRVDVNGTPLMWVHATELFECEHPEREPRRYFADHKDRLEKVLAKAVEQRHFFRVSQIGAALARESDASPEQAEPRLL